MPWQWPLFPCLGSSRPITKKNYIYLPYPLSCTRGLMMMMMMMMGSIECNNNNKSRSNSNSNSINGKRWKRFNQRTRNWDFSWVGFFLFFSFFSFLINFKCKWNQSNGNSSANANANVMLSKTQPNRSKPN